MYIYRQYTGPTLIDALELAATHALYSPSRGPNAGGLLHIYEGVLNEGFAADELVGRVALAFVDEQPIGISLVTNYTPIAMVFVQPEHREQRIGNQLLTELQLEPNTGAYFNAKSWRLFRRHRLRDLTRQP